MIKSALDSNHHVAQLLNFRLQQNLKKFPPSLNFFKFLFGKTAEIAFEESCKELGLDTVDLDGTHTSGAEYLNDLQVGQEKYSLKATGSSSISDIILVNHLSETKIHDLSKLNVILIRIKDSKIVFIPPEMITEDNISRGKATTTLKGKIIRQIINNHPEYVVNLPPLSEEQQKFVDSLEPKTAQELYLENII